jgi:competence protein ComEA
MSLGQWFRIVLAAAIAGGAVAIAVLLWLDQASGDQVTIEPMPIAVITVLIDGEVVNPGLVELNAGTRLVQVIAAAGGLTDAADVTGLNLAARVGDGEHITIPGKQSPETAPGSPAASSVSPLLNINTASAVELEQLPGIGPAIALRIVEYREFYGPFTSVDQLDEVTGISPAMVEQLRPLVTVGG